MKHSTAYWLVMPAAGTGSRMGAAIPKQYLPLAGHRVIDWSLQPFIEDSSCQGIVVSIADDDGQWRTSRWATHAKLHAVAGGQDRAASVLAGLNECARLGVAEQTWILVHDAARPCVSKTDIAKLLAVAAQNTANPQADQHVVGGLLATAMTETVKRVSTDMPPRVLETVPRELLWRAQTPQMFRLGMLRQALYAAASQSVQITDEASAMEYMGWQPVLIAGRADNLKVTVPEDLSMAEKILATRGE